MECPACGHAQLKVVNSRKQTRLRVWRRRQCLRCGLIFTSHEQPDFNGSFTIAGRTQRSSRRFSQALLLSQLFQAGGHVAKQDDLIWLAQTVASRAFMAAAKKDFRLAEADYHSIIQASLGAYDQLLAANYAARFAIYPAA